jgi:hypothetical protein
VLLYQSPFSITSSYTIHGTKKFNATPVIAPQAATVTRLSLLGYRQGTGEPLIRMELRAGGGSSPGIVLTQSEDRDGSTMPTDGSWADFEVTPYLWATDQRYWIGTWANGSSGTNLQRHYYGPWTDPDGRRIRYSPNGVSWTADFAGRGMLVQAWGFPV